MSGGLDAAGRAEVAALRDVPDLITRHLRDSLTRAGHSAARKAGERIRAAGSHHPGPLREEIAKTLVVRPVAGRDRAGVVIASLGARMPPGKRSLAYHANRGRWRHPVFADDPNRQAWTWVAQDWPTAEGWFDATLRGEAGAIQAGLERGLSEALTEAGRG